MDKQTTQRHNASGHDFRMPMEQNIFLRKEILISIEKKKKEIDSSVTYLKDGRHLHSIRCKGEKPSSCVNYTANL